MRKLTFNELHDQFVVLNGERLKEIKGGITHLLLDEVVITANNGGGGVGGSSWSDRPDFDYLTTHQDAWLPPGMGGGNSDTWIGPGNTNNPIVLPIVEITGSLPDYTDYGDGAKGYEYTDVSGRTVSVYFDPSGERVVLPDVSLSSWFVRSETAYQYNGTIHLGSSVRAETIEHEYGHYLQSLIIESNSRSYMNDIGYPSMYSLATDPEHHNTFWTETWATQLAIEFFGSNSAIARSTSYAITSDGRQ